MRQYCRHAGANVFPANDGGLAHRDTSDIGDCIQRTRRKNADFDSGFPRAWPGWFLSRGYLERKGKYEQDCDYSESTKKGSSHLIGGEEREQSRNRQPEQSLYQEEHEAP